MVSLELTQKFSIAVKNVPAGSVTDGPPTYPVDVPGIVTIVVEADGLTAHVLGVKAGTCTIQPTAKANGLVIVGAPVQVTVSAPPPPPPPPPVFATSLEVTVGPVVAQ